MKTPKWLIALVAAASFALAACDKSPTTGKSLSPLGRSDQEVISDNARNFDRQKTTVQDTKVNIPYTKVLLGDLQKEAKTLGGKWGFWNVKEVRQQKNKWESLKGQLLQLRRILDKTEGNTEFKQAINELIKKVEEASRRLDELIKQFGEKP